MAAMFAVPARRARKMIGNVTLSREHYRNIFEPERDDA